MLTVAWTKNSLSPRRLHPVLRAERAEKDRFVKGQKEYFRGCLMNVILGVVKSIAFLALRNSVFLNGTFFFFYGLLSARGLAHSRYSKWSLLRNKKTIGTGVCGTTQLPHVIKPKVVLTKEQ